MKPYACHNHEPRRETVGVRMQDGWRPDGRRNMVIKKVTNDNTCRYQDKRTDGRCAGCTWSGDLVQQAVPA